MVIRKDGKMSKTEFIKWLLAQKEMIAIELVRLEQYDNHRSLTVYRSLTDQNALLADIINIAQDISSLE